jgi:gluconolactonase
MHPSLQVYQSSVSDFINTSFEIETLDSNCQFTEGPVWNKNEGYYLFSDTTANTICKITPGHPKEVFLYEAGTMHPDDPDLKPGQGGSNALMYDHSGALLVCRHGSHDIARYDGLQLQPYITQYKGRPLNSPNDFILHRDGRIYFSDPPYGLRDGKLNPEKYQPLAGVYQWKDDELTLICDKYQYPNGVVLSPDESTLYICSNKPFEQFICMYETATNNFKGIFAKENSDGIECDGVGNVYLCNKDGLIILNTKGERMGLIQLPTIPANISWGGPDLKDAFLTARQNVFLIRNLRKF